jgi:hypothetical protein
MTTAIALGLALLPMGVRAEAAHEANVCGRLLEYVPEPSDDLAHGYAHVRLTTSSGDVGVLFHRINPSNAPSTIAPGATRIGATVCISGPYVHRVGFSPYVSPYILSLAASAAPTARPITSLPSTGTAPFDVPVVTLAGAVGLLILAFASVVRRRIPGTWERRSGPGSVGAGWNVIEPPFP